MRLCAFVCDMVRLYALSCVCELYCEFEFVIVCFIVSLCAVLYVCVRLCTFEYVCVRFSTYECVCVRLCTYEYA